ncbi:MAG: LuxR family transcriptional regulator [Actinobacteria bacterium]|nr:MAG: LuxR family transcriptional regulator [Actinomycetota bacterium]
MFGAARTAAGPLLGRTAEVELLSALLDGIGESGSALVLRGEPGIGKSRLLAEAARLARDRDITVLRTTGVQAEAHLAFAGLHQLVRPVRARAADLPPAYRTALDAAFGIAADAPPEYFPIAMAVLDLLSDVAADAPVLVTVDDAHRLDRPSADVLAFVARRVESDPIVVLVASRDGYPSPLAQSGLPEHELGALDPAAATELLDASGPQLTPAARSRLLREAAGNPLALTELPLAAGTDPPALPGGRLPLTERLERAFAARIADLPEPTRWLLLVAAIHDEEHVSEVLRAGSLAAAAELDADDLQPAADAAIVDLDVQTVRFRHPLMRSAVLQGASAQQRRRVHEALAEALQADEPDRAIWHRAALLTGVHEDVAAELEAVGQRAQRRRATDVAAAAMRRAAELSDPARRTGRLLAAAGLAFELGQVDAVPPLLHEVQRAGPGPLDQARATAIEVMIDPRPLESDDRTRALIDAAERAGAAGDRNLHIDLLWLVAVRAMWTDPGPTVRPLIVAAAARLGDARADDPRIVAIYAYADPLGHAPEVIARLRDEVARGDNDPEAARHLGAAAFIVGAFDLALRFLRIAVEGLREEGRLGHLPRGLMLYGTVAARLADWDTAIPAADEGRRLAIEFGEPMWEAGAETVAATIAGMRGDAEAAEAAAAHAEHQGLAAGAHTTVALAQVGRVLAALGTGRHDDAYASAARLFDAGDPAYHPVISSWIIGELAEAALHAGRAAEARAQLAAVEASAGAAPASWVALGLRHARALLAADPDDAAQRFDEALSADLDRWPFPRARLLLAHGQWLRRQRRVADSRAPLRAARDTFDALGCASWSDRARRELRASGESSRRRDPEARDRLTAQELQIAQLAAEGLTNRQIGQRLYLSHRTIATHLYRVFPKLGITARSELAAALAADGPPGPYP